MERALRIRLASPASQRPGGVVFSVLTLAAMTACGIPSGAALLLVELRQTPVSSVLLGTVVLIGNGRHYGGPFPLFREASNVDGKLDLIIFRGLGGMEFLQLFRRMLDEGYTQSEYLDCMQAATLSVSSNDGQDLPVELDGELVTGLGSSVDFRPAPFRLRVAA